MRKRVLIIGLDGFTWRIGHDLIAHGEMPHLGALVKKGCSGVLNSVMPFETCPAWTAFQTGCNPGKTGVFAFHTYDRAKEQTRVNCFTEKQVPSLWEIADAAGKTIVSINMPVSYPPPKVRGAVIPGLLCHELSPQTVHPPEAYDRFIKPVKGYQIVNMDEADSLREFVDWQIDVECKRGDVAESMMAAYDWDIFCVQMQSTDHFQHEHWWTIDPTAQGFEEGAHQEALRFYRSVDEVIGRLCRLAGEDTLIFTVSDHGFCKTRYYFYLNAWLRDHGYLVIRPEASAGNESRSRRWGLWKDRLKEKYVPIKKAAQWGGRFLQVVSQSIPQKQEQIFYEKDLGYLRTKIDFERSRAFALGMFGGMIYLIGPEGERQGLGKKIGDELLAMYGPGCDPYLIDRVREGSELYGDDPAIWSRPDWVAEMAHGVATVLDPCRKEHVVAKDRSSGHYFREKQHGTHDPNGIIVMAGPDVRGNSEINGKLIDITPTILAYLDIPIPRHVDGQVLNDAFLHPPEATYQDFSYRKAPDHDYSEEEQEQVERHLADLGYL